MKYLKKYTYKQWKSFNKIVDGSVVGNDLQFFNFHTQRMESYDYVTAQEILLAKYKIIITDHINRKRVGDMCPTPLKEKMRGGLKALPGKITMKNVDKSIKTFNDGVQEFGNMMDTMTKELGGSTKGKKREERKNQKNISILTGKSTKSKKNDIEKLVGKKSSHPSIWGTKKKKKKSKKRKKSKSEEWDQDEKNLTKLWGNRK